MIASILVLPIILGFFVGLMLLGTMSSISKEEGKTSAGVVGSIALTLAILSTAWLVTYCRQPMELEAQYRHPIHMVGNTAIAISHKIETLNILKMFSVIPDIEKQELLEKRWKQGPYAGLWMETQQVDYFLVDKDTHSATSSN